MLNMLTTLRDTATKVIPPFEKVTSIDDVTPGKAADMVVESSTMMMELEDAYAHETAMVPLEGFAPTLEVHLMNA
jgi:hypothetical protein